MSNVFKVALPGINASTDTDPNHYALFVDQSVDYILIKEKTPATISIGAHSHTDIAHGLGYVPMCFVFGESSAGVWKKLFSVGIDGSGLYFTIDGTNLTIYNGTASTVAFSYHIFYDNIT